MTNEREALIADLRYEAGRQGWNLPALLNKAADVLSQPSQAVPVAVVGSNFQLLYAGGDAISDIVKRHGLQVGSKLYAAPQPTEPAQPMVDCTPPATARDKWFYEQGRLAERDPRTHAHPSIEQPEDTPPNTVRFDLPTDECYTVKVSMHPLYTCMDCKASDYGPWRVIHEPGCRVAAALATHGKGGA